MKRPFLCPVCKHNRTNFRQIYKLAREIRKDPSSGELEYVSDEWETVTRDGRVDMDIQCALCDHTAAQREFVRAARREHRKIPRLHGRRA